MIWRCPRGGCVRIDGMFTTLKGKQENLPSVTSFCRHEFLSSFVTVTSFVTSFVVTSFVSFVPDIGHKRVSCS